MADFKTLDSTFSQAVAAKKIPGVVAMATTDKGVLYEGAFGQREIGKPAPMTLDTVVWIASMTKAITAAAAMQLVERGKLSLERPAAEVVSELGAARVLEGFDAAGKPRLRAPKRQMTLRHLLTHTAGFSYEIWSPAIAQFQQATGTPGITTCTNAALGTPLLFDPGDKWDYGINIDWVGKMVEAVSGQRLDRYLQDHILGPLGMKDTSFKLSASQNARLSAMHGRGENGALAPIEFGLPQEPEFHMGGGGLYGTVPDYMAFCRMIVNGGTHNGAQVLQKSTVDLMAQQPHRRSRGRRAQDRSPAALERCRALPGHEQEVGAELPDQHQGGARRPLRPTRWPGPASPTPTSGSTATKRVCGVFASQLLPFCDDTALDLLGKFETSVYQNV